MSVSLAESAFTWSWYDLPIHIQQAGDSGPPVVLIHGFGASSDHWRKNLPILGQTHRVYAIDLLGFGQSAKPQPGSGSTTHPWSYTFETWGEQIVDFCQTVIREPVFLIGNSIGCIVALQAAVLAPDWVRGVAMLNCSLRLLHERKRSQIAWHRRLSAPLLQTVLSNRTIGHFFFQRLARPQVIRKILLQAYGDATAVTDELVELLLRPAQDPGAADVFLAFIRYSQGPLPEDLLPQVSCPVLCLWGTADPWEPIELGRQLANYPVVESFIPLEGVGHCPQDEAPIQVNHQLQEWLQQHCDAVDIVNN